MSDVPVSGLPAENQAQEPPKTEKELAREQAKAEKAKKFAEKQAKQAAAAAVAATKTTKKKVEAKKEVVLAPYVEETPTGQKKILKPLDDDYHKAYVPSVVESAWYDWWEQEGFFKPEMGEDGNVKPAGYYTIAMPPPNVTGALHCGHALANALQDCLIRWNRQKGLTTLFVPGCDHAGIATQAVVEKMLWRREKKTRHDLGRQAFIDRTQEWKGDYQNRIVTVLRRMGGSYDWSREAFTMDKNLSAAVTETFVRFHEEGLIYRSNRLVNWDACLNTALSSIEVDSKEIKGRTLLDVPGYDRKVEFGVLTHFNYPIDGSDEKIEIATTRPETMFGDTGIAVHPTDKRYSHLVGKHAKHPILGHLLPIVADTYVDPEFGTGAVKITPAHDPNDFEMGKRHNLETINLLNDNGTLNENCGKYAGKHRFEARYTVVEELTQLGLFVKKVDNPMKIPVSSRSGDIVEPVMKPQWWMKMKDIGQEAIDVVKNGDIKILPQTAENSYYRWMESIHDWCLSRQLWWGHQIPAYLVTFKGGSPADDSDNEAWVTGRTEEEARKKAEAKFPGKEFTLERDPDVLDTWFSAGLWPFSTLGWPQKTVDLEKLFPTSMLETGWDILFFWVARMIMFSIRLTGKVPFKEVFCHSLIRDSEGRKMSKSLGNVIDPVDIMDGISLKSLNDKLLVGNLDPKELKIATKYQQTSFPQGIPECGSDALRFSLIQYTTGGGDISFDVKVMHGYRTFCNKIYQATKYVLGKLPAGFEPKRTGKLTGRECLADRWILHKLTTAARDVNKALEAREFSKSTQILYKYWYGQLCDVYIENSKAIIQDGTAEERQSAIDTLYTALEGGLTMLHPFMPFLSEELWQRLPRRLGDSTPSIMRAAYPEYNAELDDAVSEAQYEAVLNAAKGIRSLTSEYNIRDDAQVFVYAIGKPSLQTIQSEIVAIRALSPKAVSSITVLSEADEKPAGCAVNVASANIIVFLSVKGRVDIDAEIKKAQGKLKKASEAAKKQQTLVETPDFGVQASQAAREVEMSKLEEYRAQQLNYEQSIAQFERLRLDA